MDNIITTTEMLSTISDKLLTSKYLAFDTETDGVSRFRQPIGLSFATSAEEGYYIPLKIWENDKLIVPWSNESLDIIKNFCKNVLTKSKRLILHNAVFDAGVIDNWLNLDIIPYIHCDTMLLAHTVYNEEGPFGLKPLAAKLLDPNADQPLKDVNDSIKANGGSTTKNNVEMFKCDYNILGRYAIYDALYTFGLFNKLYPELEKQELTKLWNEEVMALLPVSYELNHNGVNINLKYFQQQKELMETKINNLEVSILNEIKPFLLPYEKARLAKEVTLTPRSVFGKLILANNLPLDFNNERVFDLAKEYYLSKHKLKSIFNLDSNVDKAILLYEILNLPQEKTTKSGKPATDADTLETLCSKYKDRSSILNKLLERAAEIKQLNTYVQPLIDNNVNGKIYTGFNQIGTISGRFSSSRPINLQTLPRDDKRVKKGFIPEEGWVFIGNDYSQLEPRAFACVANEPNLKNVFMSKNIDFYSQIAIDVFGLENVSANELDNNYLKKIYPDKRQLAKTIALAIPYGAGAGRISQVMHVDYEEARDVIERYLKAYPNLTKWMENSEWKAVHKGYVKNIIGRKRRSNLVYTLKHKYNITDINKHTCNKLVNRLNNVEGYESGIELYLAAKNNLNNAKNFQIQSLAASICNKAMIDFYNKAKSLNLKAKIILQIHDEIIITCPKDEANIAAKLLQNCMEQNDVTKLIDVPMNAEPIISDKSLAEAK